MDPNELIEALSRPDSFAVYCGPAHSHSYPAYTVGVVREKTDGEKLADALCPEDAENVYMAAHTHSGVVDALKDVQWAMNAVCGVHLSAMGKL